MKNIWHEALFEYFHNDAAYDRQMRRPVRGTKSDFRDTEQSIDFREQEKNNKDSTYIV